MKTSELTGRALGAAVALAEGREFVPYPATDYAADEACRRGLIARWKDGRNRDYACMRCQSEAELDVSWERCGPIIEQEKIDVMWSYSSDCWIAISYLRDECVEGYGRTPLIAAMRCYVASKFGDEVQIPEELK